MTALAGEAQPITLLDDTVEGGGGQYIYRAEITTSPLDVKFSQIDTQAMVEPYVFGSLSSIDECGEIQFDNGDLCGATPRSGKVTFTNIQTDTCTPGLDGATISVSEVSTCVYEFTIDGFCCPDYDEVSSVSGCNMSSHHSIVHVIYLYLSPLK